MKRLHSSLLAGCAIALALTLGAVSASAGTGNGAPSGPHFNLNLIGVNNTGVPNGTGGGNVILVPLQGRCQINLVQGSFAVLDKNCVDDGQASFQLPSPGAGSPSAYSVFVATRGKPLGSATAQTCFLDTTTNSTYCSTFILPLSRQFGGSKYVNVTKYLLYVYQCVNGKLVQTPLFSAPNQQFYWQYDNTGLKNAGLRFYPGVQTAVPVTGDAC